MTHRESLTPSIKYFDNSEEKSIKIYYKANSFNMMKSSEEQKMSRIYPPKRKVLVIEWPDQRTVFQKHKGKDFSWQNRK